jgi:nicotinate-nucleotide adenylyltransferase
MGTIGIFGGTFNPVHRGHVELVRQVQEQMQFDRLLLIPARVPPHKQVESLVSGKDRMEMLRLAFAEFSQASVCDLELHKRGKSYTVETLETLHSRFPQETLYFLMGADMLLSFDQWYRWQEILQLAVIVAAARDYGEEAALLQKAAHFGDRAIVLRTRPFPVSSTEVRKLLRAGENPGELLPPAVYHYIQAHGLYRE